MRRAVLVAAVWLLGASFAAADDAPDNRPESLDAVYACANQSADADRLACYDAAVGRLHQQEQAGQVIAVDRERASRTFGLQAPNFLSNVLSALPGGGTEVASVQSTVQSVFMSEGGRRGFHLANGQVWVQVRPEPVRNIHAGDSITIRNGDFGSYYIWPASTGRAYRVGRREEMETAAAQ